MGCPVFLFESGVFMNKYKDIMKQYNIKPTKSLGQNFLINESVVSDILDAAEISEEDLVIEIGPGLGAMTTEIANRAGNVVAVEIDKNLIPILHAYLDSYGNVKIINNDILKIDINTEIINEYRKASQQDLKVKVVSNLPYYITTPIIMKLLEEGVEADAMIFMVQLEVAERMCANPGGKEYGALSVAIRYYAEPEMLFTVSPNSFVPQPNVDSAVVRLMVRDRPYVETSDRKIFFKTVKAAFGQRRKTLVNALSNSGYFNISKERIREILISLGLNENVRGEVLTIELFAKLANILEAENSGQ